MPLCVSGENSGAQSCEKSKPWKQDCQGSLFYHYPRAQSPSADTEEEKTTIRGGNEFNIGWEKSGISQKAAGLSGQMGCSHQHIGKKINTLCILNNIEMRAQVIRKQIYIKKEQRNR